MTAKNSAQAVHVGDRRQPGSKRTLPSVQPMASPHQQQPNPFLEATEPSTVLAMPRFPSEQQTTPLAATQSNPFLANLKQPVLSQGADQEDGTRFVSNRSVEDGGRLTPFLAAVASRPARTQEM